MQLGATGKFPEGKLKPDDEGELAFAVGNRDGKVIVDFSTSVTWLAMQPAQAIQLAAALMKQVCMVWEIEPET